MSEIKPEEFIKPKRGVNRIFLHCSASDRPEDDNVKTIQSWHLARGWKDIGYHFYVDKQGRIWEGRNLEIIPAAQEGNNLATIAICCGGLADFPITQQQVLKRFCIAINDAYKHQVTFHGHREVNPNKTCPVYDYKKLLNLTDKGELI